MGRPVVRLAWTPEPGNQCLSASRVHLQRKEKYARGIWEVRARSWMWGRERNLTAYRTLSKEATVRMMPCGRASEQVQTPAKGPPPALS